VSEIHGYGGFSYTTLVTPHSLHKKSKSLISEGP
jgi:hypothetical protein